MNEEKNGKRDDENVITDIPPLPPVEVSTKMVGGRVKMRGTCVARILDKDGNIKEVKRIAG